MHSTPVYIYSMFRAEIPQPASYYMEEPDSISCNSGPQSRIAISMTSVWLWEEADTLAQIRTSDNVGSESPFRLRITLKAPSWALTTKNDIICRLLLHSVNDSGAVSANSFCSMVNGVFDDFSQLTTFPKTTYRMRRRCRYPTQATPNGRHFIDFHRVSIISMVNQLAL